MRPYDYSMWTRSSIKKVVYSFVLVALCAVCYSVVDQAGAEVSELKSLKTHQVRSVSAKPPLAHSAQMENSVEKDPRFIELERRCQKKEWTACTHLGVLYALDRKNAEKATWLYKKACAHYEVEACTYLGIAQEEAQNLDEAFALYVKGCASSNSMVSGCTRLAVLAQKGWHTKEANEILHERCDNVVPAACLASGLAELQRGRLLGLQTIRQACVADYLPACESFHSLIMSGMGIELAAILLLIFTFWLCLRPMSAEFPSPIQAFLLAAIYLLLTLILGPMAWLSPIPITLSTSLVLTLSWCVLLVFLAWRAPKSQTQCILPQLPTLPLLLAALLLGFGTHLVVSVIENIGRNTVGLADPTAGIQFSTWFTVLFSPGLEQLTFNGWILAGLLRAGKEWRAVLLSALLFSIIRVNPAELLPVFILGLVYSGLTARTRNLTYALVLEILGNLIHSLFNQFPDLWYWRG